MLLVAGTGGPVGAYEWAVDPGIPGADLPAAGASLFDRITTLDAYYPTRCEREILATHGAAILRRAAGDGPVVVARRHGTAPGSIRALRGIPR